jgi:propionyl-CoA carboxylase alpha chain
MVPGTDHAIQDIEKAKLIATEIGYPILIKASAGGGGKGMRIVEKQSEFEEQMKRAVSEAVSAFGDGSVFIEKYISSPKHIEIQVLADQHGNIVHLFERDCSIQRRHQKVVEEAPSVFISQEIRNKMGAAAVDVARACNYRGVGTVEFLMDEARNFYFLEMNTRLQVEHPITEYITGIDLVEQQILVARGEKLSFSQADLKISGHAIELRICAENPFDNFLPSTGTLSRCDVPTGKNIRVDNGYKRGDEVSVYYDPLLSKLICFGETREKAIVCMQNAIENYHIEGIETTLPFGRFVMEHEDFRRGDYSTNFVKEYFDDIAVGNYFSNASECGALLVAQLYKEAKTTLVPIKHPL